MALFLIAIVGLAAAPRAARGDERGVYVIPIEGVIDLGLAGFVDRSIGLAELNQAERIVFDIETFGGRVDAAVKIRDVILATDIPTVAYVNPRAISAGALISLACDQIYMAGGGTIGAASPVSIGAGGQSEALGEKEVSYVRTEFRATAERNGYPPLLAEAMVDKDTTVAVFHMPQGPTFVPVDEIEETAKALGVTPDAAETVIAEGKLLSLTTEDAVALGLARGRTDTFDDLLAALDAPDARVTRLHTTWSEDLVRFLTHPVINGLLMTVGLLGILMEMRTPGWGLPGTVGVIAIMLFFGAQYLVGLAEFEELLLLILGLGFLTAEIFLIPGFGVAGVLGIVCLVGAIYLSLVDVPIPQYSWDFDQLNSAAASMGTMLVSVCVLGYLMWRYVPRTQFGRGFVLSRELAAAEGYSGVAVDTMPDLGSIGTAMTVLRPAGRVQIGDRYVDAQTEGDFVEQGTRVRVIQILANAVVVEPIGASEEQHV